MYKDKDRQREANREANKRYRERQEARESCVIPDRDTSGVIPKSDTLQVTEFTKTKFPKTTRLPTHKRGKDIKCFEDLPPDVQQTIDMMSVVDGRIDQTIKANRTAIAINYQHVFPERY